MPSTIRSNRPDLSERFPVVGLTVRTAPGQSFFEVAVANDPGLFMPDRRGERTASNFYSSRIAGVLPSNHGEAVYLLPTDAVSRFAGSTRLYYALATFADRDRNHPEIVRLPAEASPFIHISKTFTGRARALHGHTNVRGGLTGNQYGAAAESLTWAGDTALAGEPTPVAIRPATATGNSASANGNGNKPGVAKASALDDYDDGYGPLDTMQEADGQDDGPGIEGPIPDDVMTGQAQGYERPFTVTPEYPEATRFVAAANGNFRANSSPRTINRVVIHITDGGRNIDGTISWFKNPKARVSAHYVIGQDGEVVQMVRHNDTAYHANSANRDSIGIEHVANVKGLMPTEAEYGASAALVRWLCDEYGLPYDRDHVLGHSEADSHTTHTDCPNAVWKWDYFMGMVVSGTSQPLPVSMAYGGRQQGTQNGTFVQKKTSNGSSNGSSFRSAGTPPSAGRGGSPSRATGRSSAELAYNIIRPTYVPGDPEEAKRFMAQWAARRERWRAGVQDTTIFPHSAICQFRITQANGMYLGTGFYIDNDLILTCAHNCADATSIQVIPGKNDLATPSEPFSSFSVPATAWTIHPSYKSDAGNPRDFDLAVIRVPKGPPNNLFFSSLEELLVSQSSPIMVCGYAAESVSQDRQHLDGDQIQTVQAETFSYDIQTEGGSSGSPVFYLAGWEDDEAKVSRQELRIVGVHTNKGKGATDNGGCRLTADKIQWIDGFRKSWSQSLGHTSKRRSAPLAMDTFSDAAVQRMRGSFVENATRLGAPPLDNLTVLKAGLQVLYGPALQNSGSPRDLGSSMEQVMASLVQSQLAAPGKSFDFVDPEGAPTRGSTRPEHLEDSLEDWVLHNGQSDGWHCFALTVLDGYHNLVLALCSNGSNAAATRLYWLDQIHGGFDDVTGVCDARITAHTQGWWDPLEPARKVSTRACLWTLNA